MSQSKIVRIIGIDPGIADTGYGIIETEGSRLKNIAHGSIKTSKDEQMPQRLLQLEQELEQIITLYQPTRFAIEKLFFSRNVTTALIVGQARGIALLVAARHNLSIHELTPLQVKQAVSGYGKADKKQIQNMIKLILNLDTVPKPDDAADALAIAISASNSYGF